MLVGEANSLFAVLTGLWEKRDVNGNAGNVKNCIRKQIATNGLQLTEGGDLTEKVT